MRIIEAAPRPLSKEETREIADKILVLVENIRDCDKLKLLSLILKKIVQ